MGSLPKRRIVFLIFVLGVLIFFGLLWQRGNLEKMLNYFLPLLNFLKEKKIEFSQEFQKEIEEMKEDLLRINKKFWQKFWQKLKDIFKNIYESIKNTFQNLWKIISPKIKALFPE